MTTSCDYPAVLVVDDEPAICDCLSSLLTRNNFLVYTASNAAEAKALLKTFTVHLLLTDNNMGPGETGVDLARYANQEHPGQFPIRFMTGMPNPRMLHPVILKPFRSQELLEFVRDAIRAFADGKQKVTPPTGDGVSHEPRGSRLRSASRCRSPWATEGPRRSPRPGR